MSDNCGDYIGYDLENYDCELLPEHDGPHQTSYPGNDGRIITATWVGEKPPVVPYDGPVTQIMELLQASVKRTLAEMEMVRAGGFPVKFAPKIGSTGTITYEQVTRDV